MVASKEPQLVENLVAQTALHLADEMVVLMVAMKVEPTAERLAENWVE